MNLNAPLIEKMSGNPWFRSLPLAERQNLVENSTQMRLAVGESLFRRGDPPAGFFGIVDGRLKASSVRSDGKEGILVILEPGNWFGQMSTITGWPSAFDVTAVEAALVLKLSPEAFNAFMQNAVFARAIAVLLCQHTSLLYQMLEDATLHSTRTRIARRLMRLARGDATLAAEHRAKIPVSQDTLAMMLGISRQTLALELKAMAAQGAVALRYGHVEIVSMDVLMSFDD
ncbi:Crp/Fnr family transcriptional regulator [Cupriavidus lacunae]|uniref:Crp/Fnr family transcriptional regulator n=1 Tax=Cupriavidus lacunae TaxID=2666307 RepID=A0A370NPJ7_9BURK|nr:Crp/Fnr family transcriptional regulator [Cupriavidus lacunae]RDK07525.1 Crp/Fnr family transcriptional regulator [Cupriavidus lacunae]